MDDRYFFFALADPEFFDMPGPGDHPEFPVPKAFVEGFDRDESGPWVAFRPREVDVPDSGWKIHVSAVPDDAMRAIDAVAQLCATESVAWKMLRTRHLVQVTQHKYAPRSLSGKVCVLYPESDEQTASLVRVLAPALEGVAGARIGGDHCHPSAPIGVRWGAYREHWVEAPDGRMVPGARSPVGEVIDDRSRPVPEIPDVIAAELRPRVVASPLPVEDVRLVHRCNAGSLYDATLCGGRRVALKEARHHTGFDGGGVDAVGRLRHEYAVLTRLSGTGVAPEPVDYWESSGSDFLVMEWVEGDTLARHISRDHPYGRPGAVRLHDHPFLAWAEPVAAALAQHAETMAACAVSHGDIHPANVIVRDGRPVLVDFEAATLDGAAVTRTIGTPGFHLDHPDPVIRDRHAIARTAVALREADVPLQSGYPVEGEAGSPTSPDMCIDDGDGGVDVLRRRLAEGLLSRATPERTDRLFCGGIEQFTTPLGGHNLLSGAAGVLLALRSIGFDPAPQHLDWLAATPEIRSHAIHGLAEGVDGVALALALLGRPEQAADLMKKVPPNLPASLSWTRGRAGCAVALVELGILLGISELTERGLEAAEALRSATYDSSRTVVAAGLLEGWAGISLALMRIGEVVPNEAPWTHSAAMQALRRERDLLTAPEGHLVATPSGRVRVGLGHGSGAFALALACSKGVWPEDHAAVTAGMRARRWPSPGLMDGLSGMAVTLRLAGDLEAAAHLDEASRRHVVRTSRGWSLRGAGRLRCSDDLMTGAAGMIVGMGDGSPERLRRVLRLPGAPVPVAVDDTCHVAPLAAHTDVPAHIGV